MRIFFVADVNDCQMQYERVSAIYGDDKIISFVKETDKDACKIDCPAVVYYSGKIYDAFKPYCAEDDTLIVFASANADEYMLQEIQVKSKDNDIVYVRRRKENAFTRFMHKLYNIFVRIILSKRDSCASSKIIYLSAKAMKDEIKNGAKFRFLLKPELKTEEVIYTPGTKPLKVKKKWSKHCWISLAVFAGLTVVAVVLDLIVKMPFILQISFDLAIVVTYAMQLHRIPTGLYRQDTVLKVFQEIYWYIPYRNSASSKRNFLRLEVLLLQTHNDIPVCDGKAQRVSDL